MVGSFLKKKKKMALSLGKTDLWFPGVREKEGHMESPSGVFETRSIHEHADSLHTAESFGLYEL